MRASFVETMRGELSGAGKVTPVSFSAVAEAVSWRSLLTSGQTRLRGLVRAPPWASEAEADGTLELRPRQLTYAIHFVADDGAPMTLAGQKHPRPLAPLSSMTTMAVELRRADGVRVAAGTMRFALLELLPFLLSYLPWPKRAERRLDAERRRVVRRRLGGAA